jgi:hypothetical protein
MRQFLLSMALSLVASAAFAQDAAPAAVAAEVKIGTAVVNHEIEGEATAFTVAPDTRLYAWVKVTGAADSTITVAFLKDGAEVSKVELSVPRSPYRTHAYKTIRAGDAGSWTASVRSADGAELTKADFTVALTP